MTICVCAVCGVEFQRQPYHLRPGAPTYCSRACVGMSKRHGSALFCAYCDAEFYRRFGEQDIGERVRQFCSRPCYMQWRAEGRKDSTYPKVGPEHVHRIVAAAVLGRVLAPGEVVHHIDLDKHNAHPSNLAVFPDQSHHMRCHLGKMSASELRRFSLVKDPG